MTDPNSVCFSLNTGAFPVEMLRLDGSGFHYKGKVIEDAGEAYNLFKQWLVMVQQPSQEAEPVAGKVVAWGVFANIDGEWQLQHPVFTGDEQGKVNAEFERASYSGPQPLEVRPLGVVTATAQQAEPVEPVGWNWMLDGQPYGQAYYGNPPDTDIAERAAIAGRTVRLLYTAPPQRTMVPLTEEEIKTAFHAARNAKLGASQDNSRHRLSVIEIARAVEQALWEKHHG